MGPPRALFSFPTHAIATLGFCTSPTLPGFAQPTSAWPGVWRSGMSVLVPNLFYRTSKLPVFDFPLKFGDERTTKRLGELSAPLTPDAMGRDASAYVDFLAARETVDPGPMGVVGFCFSGAMAMRAAAARPDRIAAAASLHGGRLYTDQPTSPHRQLPRIKARLYFGHAVDDKSMPAESISQFEEALRASGGRIKDGNLRKRSARLDLCPAATPTITRRRNAPSKSSSVVCGNLEITRVGPAETTFLLLHQPVQCLFLVLKVGRSRCEKFLRCS